MTLPNALSLFRLLVTPLIIWFIINHDLVTASLLFLGAGLTDLIDGYIARRFHMESKLGALLDPIADKVLLTGCYISLGIAGYLPLWIIILVLVRDVAILIAALFVFAYKLPVRLEPIALSKLNTLLQILLVLMVLTLDKNGTFTSVVLLAGLIGVACTTATSGIAYTWLFIKQVSKSS